MQQGTGSGGRNSQAPGAAPAAPGASSKGLAMRSDSTRPGSARGTGLSSTAAGSLSGRQPSGGSLTARSGRPSLGGSTTTAAGAPWASASTIAAARQGGSSSATATADAPAMQSNVLYRSDSGLKLQQGGQHSDAASSLLASAARTAHTAAAASAAAPAVAPAAAAKTAPQAFLDTTGDLFRLPDQGEAAEAVCVDVGGAQLASPAWNQARPWLTGSWLMERPPGFVREAGGREPPSDPASVPAMADLSRVPVEVADSLLADDLLMVFMGQAGQYIKAVPMEHVGSTWPRLGLCVAGVPDPSLQEQVGRLLPLCEHVLVVKRFVETRSRIDQPLVLQALAAAMRKLQEEWWLLVVQLEHQLLTGQLTLAGLVYYCQAPAASMQLLADIAGEAAASTTLTSAELLNKLLERRASLAGNWAGQQLVGQLLQAAAEPYFGILRQWLTVGVLDDPHNEFMIKEDTSVTPDSVTDRREAAYWTQRFKVRTAVGSSSSSSGSADGPCAAGAGLDVPVFLESSVDAILVTGKYLNVIRLCGQPVPPAPESTLEQLRYDAAASEAGALPFLGGIQAALSAAAGALLDHMMGPQGRLLSWLHCLKHFFLLDQGDLLVHLLEAGDAEAEDPLKQLEPHQLQGLLEAALRSSSVAASPHVDVVAEGALGVRRDSRDIVKMARLYNQLAAASSVPTTHDDSLHLASASASRGWLDLLLTINVSWPLKLVVCDKQLLAYQTLFKLLLHLKHAERQLGSVWQALRATKRLSREDQELFRPWHLLCSRLQHVVGEVLRYVSIDVLEPLWGDMHERVKAAGNMDEVIRLHDAFLRTALDRALVRNQVMLHAILHLLGIAADLAAAVSALPQERGAADVRAGGGAAAARAAASTRRVESRKKQLSEFCRQVAARGEVAALQRRADEGVAKLLAQLAEHYEALSSGNGGSAAAAGGGAAGGGDSGRELASLHNLMQRLQRPEDATTGVGAAP